MLGVKESGETGRVHRASEREIEREREREEERGGGREREEGGGGGGGGGGGRSYAYWGGSAGMACLFGRPNGHHT